LQVIGVSEDTVDSQKKFKDEQKLPFTLVADSDGELPPTIRPELG
jgi:peroxiredoxin